MPKESTRDIAARLGLPVAAKPDSQDICFVPQGSYAQVVAKLRPEAAAPGEIVHVDGRVLGRHAGVLHYTVGQRRGLAVATGERLYVVRLEPERRRVVVGPPAALACRGAELREVNWLGREPLTGNTVALEVKCRAQESPVAAGVTGIGEGAARVAFAVPQAAVAPGQACVFYRGSRVLGGGWIARALPAGDA
jgi:tRNA-specific 2-thiouridylase